MHGVKIINSGLMTVPDDIIEMIRETMKMTREVDAKIAYTVFTESKRPIRKRDGYRNKNYHPPMNRVTRRGNSYVQIH